MKVIAERYVLKHKQTGLLVTQQNSDTPKLYKSILQSLPDHVLYKCFLVMADLPDDEVDE
jgi:hypothetical protein